MSDIDLSTKIGNHGAYCGCRKCIDWHRDRIAKLEAQNELLKNGEALRLFYQTRNWDGSEATHPTWEIQSLYWSKYAGQYSSREKAQEALVGILSRDAERGSERIVCEPPEGERG